MEERVRKRIQDTVKKLFGIGIDVEVSPAPVETGADCASNVALKLAGVVREAPRVVAEKIKQALEGEWTVEVAGPGFLNFISPDEYYADKLVEIARDRGFLEKNISQDEYNGKTVVAEFSDPNPFKVLHVGHLYTSIVGDSISRLLELAGAKVVRANFGGDVGLHVAKTLWCMRRKIHSSMSINDIAECYVEGTRAYDEDEDAKKEINELNRVIYALAELGEEKCHERLELEMVAEDFGWSTAEVAQVSELYWRGRELSYEYFKDFYARIGVKFDKFYPESSVAGRGLKEVRGHVGSVYEESDGAIVFRGEKVGLHTRVFINREGVPTYEAKDVGLIFTKWRDFQFDESVVITGNEQTEYMKVVLASVKEYAPKLVERTRHLTHGLVKLPGNVKMSSRKGNFLKAVEVIELVNCELSEASSDEARPDSPSLRVSGANPRRSSGPSSEESQIAPNNNLITLAAIKYAFLKYKMGGDIVFDPKESVSTTGNSGVYLLYSTVRAKKILSNCKGVSSEEQRGASLLSNVIQNQFVRGLSKKIVQYENVLKEAVAGMAPYKLCAYLYELAQEFSRFYENIKVVGSENEAELAVVVRAYVEVMEGGLDLLGIKVPEEM